MKAFNAISHLFFCLQLNLRFSFEANETHYSYKLSKYIDLNDDQLAHSLQNLSHNDSMISFFNNASPQSFAETPTITVILNQYKRNHIERQINMILNQTLRNNIIQIYIYQNENHIDLTDIINNYNEHAAAMFEYTYFPTLKLIHNKHENFRYHGRFTLPLLIDTEYVAIFDDDIIAGERYLENCLRLVRDENVTCGPGMYSVLNVVRST